MNTIIALAGNPNCGKTTMFNTLTGSTQYVGNWPGVTVEKKEGPLRTQKTISVVDLPGTYSLSPYSPEEIVSRDYLLSGQPNAILNLVDGTNLERNLYLTTQLLETGIPLVVALNMMDIVRKNGDKINIDKLSAMLGCQIAPTSALKGEGCIEAALLAAKQAANKEAGNTHAVFSPELENHLSQISAIIQNKVEANQLRWYTIKLFENEEATWTKLALDDTQGKQIKAIIQQAETEFDDDGESIITCERYAFIAGLMDACVKKSSNALSSSDKIDQIVTNRWLALPIFALVMTLVYYVSIKSIGDFVTNWTNDVLFGDMVGGGLASLLDGIGAAPWLTSLVVDGIVAGVGAILGFVPQMIILFTFLSFLEDCGYMARVAFIMDRVFRKFGLSGKSFIPMLISSGCGVPGIMATKTIENEKDRRMTIITTTFIPCSAKLPIIALLTGSIFSGAWWVSPLIYFAGIASVIVSGIILKKTKLFAGDPAPFVMELPQYHLPAVKSLFMHVWERVKSFVVKAGTVIFVSSIIIWFLLSFGLEGGSFSMVESVDNSFMAMLGGVLAPIFIPLGFGNWQATVGTISGLVAKENLVSTLAIIHGLSGGALEEILEESQPLWPFMQTILPSMAAGLSFLIFNMLCAPCFAAIGAVRRQMGNGKWTAFTILFQTGFAYCISLMIYQIGIFISTGIFTFGTFAGFAVLAAFLFLLLRPGQQKNALKKAPVL